MKMVILTCKHHDGFCLWPTKTTDHSIASSPWKDGKGDVVKELKEACDEYGLKFGVYLSPWDRNAECYGDSEKYNQFFLDQLNELLSWYGQVDEVWFDGACGEGPNGKKQVYDWDAYYAKIAELQPNAVTAIMGRDIRWVGTESGYGRETEWSTTALPPGGGIEVVGVNKHLNINAMSKNLGSRDLLANADQMFWYPAEVDVSIRPGWFYHKHEDKHVKTLNKLVDIYFSSVGRNAVLLLNIPPDKRGLINEVDVTRLEEFRAYLDATFIKDFLLGAKPNSKSANKAVDDDANSYWQTEKVPASVEFKLREPQTFNVLMLQEYIRKGQRVEKFKLEAWINGEWVNVKGSTTIGYKKLLPFKPVSTDRIRLTIEQSRGNALISNAGLYYAPELLSEPMIRRDKNGTITIKAETDHPSFTYTLDGSEPTPYSKLYLKPFALPGGGTIKVKAFINDYNESSITVSEEFDVCPAKWQVVDYSDADVNHPPEYAIDGDIDTYWHTTWVEEPTDEEHHITVDLGETLLLKGFTYQPRNEFMQRGVVSRYTFLTSMDGAAWEKAISHGEFSNIANNQVKQKVVFPVTHKARYIKFISHETISELRYIGCGELGVITK